ncbi:hypothetical protein QYZ87_03250 [Porphyromonadaceae bacterium W3.11]|nr:hypothetical protein [Porphyromonadaceae bacterium W3.11]
MRKIRIYAILLVVVAFTACKKDDFKPHLGVDLEENELVFSFEGGEQSFTVDSNEEWFVSETPNWINVIVSDIPSTRSAELSYEKGIKEITVQVKENPENKTRVSEVLLISKSKNQLKIGITQQKRPRLLGYWILSEGNMGKNDSEIAWFDIAKGEVSKKQFKAINGKKLGDTGNSLKVYGSKMYIAVTGPGFGAGSEEGTNYVEVLDLKTGKSIKRLPFQDKNGAPAKPRNIISEGGKLYISSYSNEVVRLDTLSLELDGHAALSGTLAEGLTYYDGNIYVCNSGQGADNKISVVNVSTMTETKIITTAKNPTGIVSANNGILYFNTNYPEYALYKLNLSDDSINKIEDVNASDITYKNNKVYTCEFNWSLLQGSTNVIDVLSGKASSIDLDLEGAGISLLMEYHIGTINNSNYLYLTGMGQDVVIFDPSTNKIVHAIQTGVANACGVVAVYE